MESFNLLREDEGQDDFDFNWKKKQGDRDTWGRWRLWVNEMRQSREDGSSQPASSSPRALCSRLFLYAFAVIGLIQALLFVAGRFGFSMSDRIHQITSSWGKPGQIGAGLAHWPTDFTGDILPIPCHSHNDYWRAIPLYSAIEAGCIGVEADVWLWTDEIYVGHTVTSLTANRTLQNLYIDPLMDVLAMQNPEPTIAADLDEGKLKGVFDTDPAQQLILLIDFKTDGDKLFPRIVDALQPLREKGYLTRRNGTELVQAPLIVVGTGGTPFDMVTSESDNPYHDIFFDAPLNEMYEATDDAESLTDVGQRSEAREELEPSPDRKVPVQPNRDIYSASNSFYASTSFTEAIGILLDGQLSPHQLQLLRGQIRGAHRRGLKARYWELPFWPISLRNHVWDVLVKEGIDLLNVDDLEAASKRDWSKDDGWWDS